MDLIRDRQQQNHQSPLPKLKIISCEFSPFPNYFPKPISDTSINGVGDFTELEKLYVLGHGNHGIVYKVCHRPTLSLYALKIIRNHGHETDQTSVSHETEILSRANSPFIVKCYGIFEPCVGEKAILMEYMDAGTLDTLLKTNGPFSESSLAHIAYQVLSGLKYLHASNIVHLDIKPSNLLANKDMKVKIGDFGVSKIIDSKLACHNFCGGTRAYMSPERLDWHTFGSDEYVYGGDVWSFGVTLLELYVGHFPFFPPKKRPSWMELVLVICSAEFPCLPKEASEEFKSFIRCCLEKEPGKRWTVIQLLSHPYICLHGCKRLAN